MQTELVFKLEYLAKYLSKYLAESNINQPLALSFSLPANNIVASEIMIMIKLIPFKKF